MICSDAAEIRMSDQAHLSGDALLKLASLIARPAAPGFTITFCKRLLTDAREVIMLQLPLLSLTRTEEELVPVDVPVQSRTGQSHGPHSGDGISNGRKEDR